MIDVRIKALERQIDILKNAVAQPTGIFETIDSMIKTFRMANRETLQAIGIPISGQLRVLERSGAPALRSVSELQQRLRLMLRRRKIGLPYLKPFQIIRMR